MRPGSGEVRTEGRDQRSLRRTGRSGAEVYTILISRLLLQDTGVPSLADPATRYEPSPLIELSSRAERQRLSSGALKAFFSIVERWELRGEDARQLLGGVTNGPYYAMKKHPQDRVLDADRLMRISCLIGIFKALNILHSQMLADEWVRLPGRWMSCTRASGDETVPASRVSVLHLSTTCARKGPADSAGVVSRRL